MIFSKRQAFYFICLQNFLEAICHYILNFLVYEIYAKRIGGFHVCSNWSIKENIIGLEFVKFLFYSLPTYLLLKNYYEDKSPTKLWVFVRRNMIISFGVHLIFFTIFQNHDFLSFCTNVYWNNGIHVLELITGAMSMYFFLMIYRRYFNQTNKTIV